MKPAPEIKHPGDVAALRLWLLDALSDGRPLARAYNGADKVISDGMVTNHGMVRVAGARPANQWWSQDVLPKANLYYFGEEVVDLMQEVSQSVPDVVMDTALLPAKKGMLVFGKTWWGVGSDGKDVPVDAIVWGETIVPTSRLLPELSLNESVSIGLLARSSSMQPNERGTEAFGGDQTLWAPLGRTDYVVGWKRSDHEEMDTNVAFGEGTAALDQDRMMALAAWTIINQPGLSTQHDERSKTGEQAHRRSARKQDRKSETPPVRVIYLPERHTSSEATGTGTKLDHRVYVAPFWRQQPYGPASSLRRPVLVRGHIRGPEGTPLVRRDVVRAKITP